jgi:hypothetical protein
MKGEGKRERGWRVQDGARGFASRRREPKGREREDEVVAVVQAGTDPSNRPDVEKLFHQTSVLLRAVHAHLDARISGEVHLPVVQLAEEEQQALTGVLHAAVEAEHFVIVHERPYQMVGLHVRP